MVKTEPLIGTDFGDKLPPHRAFRVVLDETERIVLAHSMSVIDGAIVFYSWRVETLLEQPTVIQYCTDAFATWAEAHEVQMPAMPAGKAH